MSGQPGLPGQVWQRMRRLDIRENTKELLELFGFRVVATSNGEEGLILAADVRPDVILCDIMMPGLDGYQVIQQMKADPSLSGIAFIYLTSSGEKNEIRMAMDMGADGYLRKPFEGKELIAEIQKCLNNPMYLS